MKDVVLRRTRWCLAALLAGIIVGLFGATARAELLYNLPFQNASENGSLTNLGTVGGAATAVYGGGSYTNNTPPNVGCAFAWNVPTTTAAISLPDSNTRLTLTNAGDQISVLAWVKLDGQQTVQGIANAIGTGMTNGWTFNLRDSRKVTFQLGNGTTIQRQSSAQIPTNVWTHVAFTFTAGGGNSALKIYVNGVSVSHTGGDLSSYVAMKNVNIPIKVGLRDVGTWALYGIIDDVRLYDEILPQEEIQDIMNPPKGPVIMIQ